MNLIQNRLLEIMDWYHSFCIANNLNYYLLGGSMLGAARHQGFIPWDDDIDVGMPRADYDRFVKIMTQGTNDYFVLESFKNGNRDFPYAFAKIYDIRTTLIEKIDPVLVRGLYIDVFPLDGAGNDYNAGMKHIKRISRRLWLIQAMIAPVKKGRSTTKRMVISLGKLARNNLFSTNSVLKSIDQLSRKYDFDSCKYVANLVGDNTNKEVMEREYFGIPTLCDFEGKKYYGVQYPDKYLTKLFGEWRKLPPKDKRESHHERLEVDFSLPYLKREQ